MVSPVLRARSRTTKDTAEGVTSKDRYEDASPHAVNGESQGHHVPQLITAGQSGVLHIGITSFTDPETSDAVSNGRFFARIDSSAYFTAPGPPSIVR
jgi:hypothetical protein